MSPLLLGIIAALVIGLGASIYLWTVRRRQSEMAAGLAALAAMRWRDFSTLVLRMLKERGYTEISRHSVVGDQRDFFMQRAGEQCIVSCKHGSVYHLGAADLKDLGNNIRLHDAGSGMMVTAGQFASDAQAEATRQRIELVDGAALWPEVVPLLPVAQLQHLQVIASARAKREIGIAWLLAVIAGAGITVLLPPDTNTSAEVATAARQPSAPEPAAIDPAAGQAPVAPAVTGSQPPPLPPRQQQETQQQEPQQRQDALSAVKALPGVERALWSTQSTLSVFLLVEKEQPWQDICEVLSRYPAVRAVRVQLTPPAGSASLVRFRQCYAY